jgi:hypothetical protein
MAQNSQNQNQRRYQCSICNELFSYPMMPWRVYDADSNALLFSAPSLEEAERWARKNCYRLVTCI